jgi:hypothetical protein
MLNKKIIKKYKNTTSGFALLFSIVVSTVIISISASIMSISIRQTILSNTSRDSQAAFYAANTGLECAFFWDNHDFGDVNQKMFPVLNGEVLPSGVLNNRCVNQVLINSDYWEQVINRDRKNETSFNITIQNTTTNGISTSQTCSIVKVQKDYDSSNGIITTTIDSKGYNFKCDDLSNPRAVERGLQITYKN